MSSIRRARRSLFARMGLIFGLLVTVPLAVSGLLLSLVGRSSMLTSGRAMSRLGEHAVMRTRDSLVRAVQGSISDVTERVSGSAQRALEAASQKHIETSDQAVGQATTQIITNSRQAFQNAGQQSGELGKKAVLRAADELRNVHQDSLGKLTTEFVKRTRDELTTQTQKVRPDLVQPVIELAYSVNDERAAALVLTARRGLTDLQGRLSVTSRTGSVQQFDEDHAMVPILSLTKPTPRSLTPSQVILVSTSGQEVVRFPEPQDAAAPPSWRNSPEFTLAQRQEDAVLPLQDDPKGVPVLRLVRRVQSLADEPNFGMLVADVPLTDVATMAASQSGNPSSTMLLLTTDARVLSSSVPAQVGKKLSELAFTLKNVPETAESGYRLKYPGSDGKVRLGVARRWIVEKGPTNIIGLVTQPEADALQPVDKLQQAVGASWQRALENVGGSSQQVIASRMEEIRPKQAQIAQTAAGAINQNIRAVGEQVPAAMVRYRNEILKHTGAEIARDTHAATKATADEIQDTKRRVANSARGLLSWTSNAEAVKSVEEMNQATRGEANRQARQMILNSIWLIAMFLCLALFLATLTTRSIVRPVDRLVRGTQALAAGDFAQRIPVETEDELGRLAGAFNSMAAAIQTSQNELHRSHDSLMAQKQRVQTIVDSSPDGLVMIEPGGRVSFMNPAARAMLSARELPLPPFNIREVRQKAAQRLRDCLADLEVGGPARELEIAGPPRRILQYRGVAIAGEEGQHPGLLLHFHDITRERQIDEMKTDFISLVSHELRTPLTSILGFSSYLLTGKLGPISETQERALDSIHRQSKRLSAIISDFLDVSRIESGRIEMRKDPVSIDAVARRVAADLLPQAAEKGIQVQVNTGGNGDPVMALGDEARVAQVFTNLMGNALKFTEQEGRVDVDVARMNGEVVCKVRDTGCGIPKDELERVFDRFYQVEKVVTRKSGGTGLGLAIVKNIIEAHGGRVWIDSEPGQGTEVTFTLPGS